MEHFLLKKKNKKGYTNHIGQHASQSNIIPIDKTRSKSETILPLFLEILQNPSFENKAEYYGILDSNNMEEYGSLFLDTNKEIYHQSNLSFQRFFYLYISN